MIKGRKKSMFQIHQNNTTYQRTNPFARYVFFLQLASMAISHAFNLFAADLTCNPPPQVPELSEYRSDLNINYTTVQKSQLKLDIFRPNGNGPFPVVVLLHSGAWAINDKTEMANVAKVLTLSGYAAIPVNYRLARVYKNNFPAAVQDVRCAVQWIRANASQYQLKSDEIVAMGISAGGHLASMLGTSADEQDFNNVECIYQDQPATVSAAISISGPQDFTVEVTPTVEQFLIMYNFLGHAPQSNFWLQQQASPTHYVSQNTPPFLLIHGTNDTLVPASQSRVMRDKLQEYQRPVKLLEIFGKGHEIIDILRQQPTSLEYCAVIPFLKEHLHLPLL